MKHGQTRFFNSTTQDYLRQQAIRLRIQGKQIGEIAVYLGVHRTTVSEWWQQYQAQGEAALHQQKRGSRVGTGRSHKLSCYRRTRSSQRELTRAFPLTSLE